MSASSHRLVIVLRVTAVLLLLAFIGTLLPERVMRSIYESGDSGPWPGGPLVLYLARVVSILYGFLGVLTLYLSFDVERYRPLVRFLALISFPFVPVMFLVIWSAGLPTIWLVSEPVGILIISALWYTASREPSAS
jgi:hypothetical protein